MKRNFSLLIIFKLIINWTHNAIRLENDFKFDKGSIDIYKTKGLPTTSLLVTTFILIILVFIPYSSFATPLGSIAVDLTYTNGDIADYYPISLKIYQDFNSVPYKTIDALSSNPFYIVALPVGYHYKIEAYANGLHAGVGYVNLDQSHQDLTITLPLPGGLRPNVFYNDGQTPINNAAVHIRSSSDNKTWAQGLTNYNGKTMRFWLEPTVFATDHYVVDIIVGKSLVYSESNIFVQTGIPQELKIVTNWPPVVNSLITAKVSLGEIQNPKDKIFISMIDESGHEVSGSLVNSHGEVYFSNVPVGDYSFNVFRSSDNSQIGNLNVTIDGSNAKIPFIIPINETVSQIHSPKVSTIVQSTLRCNCIAFSLDNVQDFWLDQVQLKILDTFNQENAVLTLGVVGNAFGNDSLLSSAIKTGSSEGKIDVAANGWNFEDFVSLSRGQQTSLLSESKNKISFVTGILPTVFIPPYSKVNDDTFYAMDNNGFKISSTSSDVNLPVGSMIHNLPTKILISGNQSITTHDYISSIKDRINDDGFVVVMINFQGYAQNNGSNIINSANDSKILRLSELIDEIKRDSIKIVTIKQIPDNLVKSPIPLSIREAAASWAEDQRTTKDFLKSIQLMSEQHIISQSLSSNLDTIPRWMKHNAGWWTSGQISDGEFVNSIEYLITQRIIL